MKVNQWQNSAEVIKWFKTIENKSEYTFTIFDIQEFYPSISEDLLQKAITFAKSFVQIESEDFEVIFHARKSLLYNNNKLWIRKHDNGEFDVTMGSYDGAEVCELIGLFLLDLLAKKYRKEDIGWYRDDGLAIFKGRSGRIKDMIRKDIIKIFKDHNLNLEIQCNLKCVDYLDVTLDLTDGTYRPFNKPNNSPTYVPTESNHPPSMD